MTLNIKNKVDLNEGTELLEFPVDAIWLKFLIFIWLASPMKLMSSLYHYLQDWYRKMISINIITELEFKESKSCASQDTLLGAYLRNRWCMVSLGYSLDFVWPCKHFFCFEIFWLILSREREREGGRKMKDTLIKNTLVGMIFCD